MIEAPSQAFAQAEHVFRAASFRHLSLDLTIDMMIEFYSGLQVGKTTSAPNILQWNSLQSEFNSYHTIQPTVFHASSSSSKKSSFSKVNVLDIISFSSHGSACEALLDPRLAPRCSSGSDDSSPASVRLRIQLRISLRPASVLSDTSEETVGGKSDMYFFVFG
jgi:hypothetical protein